MLAGLARLTRADTPAWAAIVRGSLRDMSAERAQVRIQTLIDQSVASGHETGLQVAVIKDGQLAIDAISGLADPRSGTAVSTDSLFWAGSTAKGVAASVAHVLAERGELDYDLRVAEVWPEFASHGKDTVTLRHVLQHTAGLPGLPPDTTVRDLCDWDRMCAALAAAQLWWEPGTRFGYHAKTFGFLLGEIIRRATGHTISAVLRDAITRPLGVEADVHFRVPEPMLGRVAMQVSADGPPPEAPAAGSPLDRAMPVGVRPDADYANRRDLLTSDVPSEGTMTARGVARIYAALLGDIDEVFLVSSQRLAAMAAVTVTATDEVMGFPATWAFGYSPSRPGGSPSRLGSAFGMVGMNGSAAYADIDTHIAVALMRNRFTAGLATAGRIDRIVAEELA